MRVWVRVHKFWFVCFLGGDVSRASSELSFECAEVRAADVDSLGGMLKPTVFRFNYVFAHRLPMKFFINFLISVLIKIFVFMFWFFLWIPLVIKEDDLYISGLQAAEMVGTFPMWGLRGLFLMYFCTDFWDLPTPPKTAGACPHCQHQTGSRVHQPWGPRTPVTVPIETSFNAPLVRQVSSHSAYNNVVSDHHFTSYITSHVNTCVRVHGPIWAPHF